MIYDCVFCNNYSASGDEFFVREGEREHRKICPARIRFRTGQVPEGYYITTINGKPTYLQIPGYAEERFTGFDGIPDWTDKDSEIARWKADYKVLVEDFYRVSEARDAAVERLTRIEKSLNVLIEGAETRIQRGQPVVYLHGVVSDIKYILK